MSDKEKLGGFVFHVVEDKPERVPHTPCIECRYYQPGRISRNDKVIDGCGYIAMGVASEIRAKQKTAHCSLWRPQDPPPPPPVEENGPLMVDARWFAVVFLVEILVWTIVRST